jgi:hypothetical protein
MRRSRPLAGLALLALALGVAHAAPPDVPDAIAYEGLLLEGLG